VSHIRPESGQASVETVAMVPLVLLAAAMAWQLVLTGHTLWVAAGAARAGARAELVGESPARAARSALPRSLERGMSVKRVDAGGVRVEVRLPLMVPSWKSPIEIAAASSLGAR
jgi:pilus assembly protein CpaE